MNIKINFVFHFNFSMRSIHSQATQQQASNSHISMSSNKSNIVLHKLGVAGDSMDNAVRTGELILL